MANNKIVPINYTARDFGSIKSELVEYTKRYYPDNYKDFNQASFGSLTMDLVSYVGDILSFYLDYQVNESFLLTAIERKNIINNARALGYKFKGSPSASGIASLYISIPATVSNEPDLSYVPILKKGAIFGSTANSTFILNENVDFSVNPEITIGSRDPDTGVPTSFIFKKFANVISGIITTQSFTIGTFTKFLSLQLSSDNIVEVLSVKDSEGNEYYEVDSLSQNIIYRAVTNTNADKMDTPAILKPVSVPRRFTVDLDQDGRATLTFGYGSDESLRTLPIADPSQVILQQYGKDYVVDNTFDPYNLNSTDKFGIAPANTTLTVVYRYNNFTDVNIAVNSLTRTIKKDFVFLEDNLNAVKRIDVISSLEVDNEQPLIGNISPLTNDEIKLRSLAYFASQNRAVTKQDYISLVYSMPAKFGAVKRVNIAQDKDSFKRNLNMYVVSENSSGFLTKTNDTTKNNLKNWLINYKMINDTIDLLDAKIINIGIEFEIIATLEKNKFDVLEEALQRLKTEVFNKKYDIGESFYFADIYNILNRVEGVLDTKTVKVKTINSLNYSQIPFDISGRTSADGRYIEVPEDYILEVKNVDIDIRGSVV
jgi:hypothetical protein